MNFVWPAGAKLIALGVGLLALAGFLAWVFDKGAQHERAAVNTATLAQVKEDAALSARRVQNLSEIAHDASIQADAARAAAASAGRSRDALRVRLDAFVAHARPADSPASAAGPAIDPAVSVLAKLFLEARDFAAEVAADADASRIAGSACEAAYGQLTP